MGQKSQQLHEINKSLVTFMLQPCRNEISIHLNQYIWCHSALEVLSILIYFYFYYIYLKLDHTQFHVVALRSWLHTGYSKELATTRRQEDMMRPQLGNRPTDTS